MLLIKKSSTVTVQSSSDEAVPWKYKPRVLFYAQLILLEGKRLYLVVNGKDNNI